MKSIKYIYVVIFLLVFNQIFAQEIIKLSEPNKMGGKPLMEALNDRSSSRDFVDSDLNEQQISNLLWAANGVNREDKGKRTAPSSHNNQDIDIYISTSKGLFLYKPEEHGLLQLSELDMRKIAGSQDFVKKASVNLIYVSNFEKLGKSTDEIKVITAAAHCGFIGQNVYLYCASEGLISVFRAWINKEKIAEALKLSKNQHVMYCQSVGHSKVK
jgi:SagB-type dehydrogenase family enzyme